MGRATQGVRLINLSKKNDVIASVCKVMSQSDEEVLEAETEADAQGETDRSTPEDINNNIADMSDVENINDGFDGNNDEPIKFEQKTEYKQKNH